MANPLPDFLLNPSSFWSSTAKVNPISASSSGFKWPIFVKTLSELVLVETSLCSSVPSYSIGPRNDSKNVFLDDKNVDVVDEQADDVTGTDADTQTVSCIVAVADIDADVGAQLPNCPPPNIRSRGKQDVERPAQVLRLDSPLFSPVTIKMCRLAALSVLKVLV